MDTNLFDYYSRELRYLRESGANFADAHKEEAAHLGIGVDRESDPHVERLLQGVAFLTARIRRKLDDQFPELTDSFLSVAFPQCTRPVPSLAVAQIRLPDDPTKVAEGAVIPRGTVMEAADAVEGIVCRFQTCYETALWPVSVTSVRLVVDPDGDGPTPTGTRAALRLGLECTAQGGWKALAGLESLRIFLAGEPPIPTSIYELLFAHLKGIRVRGADASGTPVSLSIDRDKLRPVGFHDDESLWPYPSHVHPGYQRLQEFFAFREKFLFVDLGGLGAVVARGLRPQIEVVFYLDAPPRSNLELRERDFRLFSTPIVNLFPHVLQPVVVDRRRSEYLLEADTSRRDAYELVAIDRVVSRPDYLEEPRTYHPFYDLMHATAGPSSDLAYWMLSRRRALGREDEGFENYLAFADPAFRPTSPGVEVLTVYGQCCNKALPASIPIAGHRGSLSIEHASAGVARLLTQPTRMLEPPRGDASRWRSSSGEAARGERRRSSVPESSAQWSLIAALQLNHLSLTSGPKGLAALKALLQTQNFPNTDSTRQMIAGIIDLKSEEIAARAGNRLGHAVSLGHRIELEFDEAAFSGDGTLAFLMATVLEDFLASFVSLNSFTQTVARSKQRKDETWKVWPPRCGDRPLI